MSDCKPERPHQLDKHWHADSGDFPVLPREWFGGATNVDAFLDGMFVIGPRGTLRRLLEDVPGLLSALVAAVGRIRVARQNAGIRLSTNDDRPPKVIVEFSVNTPEEAIQLVDELDRSMLDRASPANRRIIVDAYYQ